MTNFDDVDKESCRIVGKPISECTKSERDIVRKHIRDEATGILALLDRYQAALNEAARCGCDLDTPRLPDGSPDLGRAAVIHSCGLEK